MSMFHVFKLVNQNTRRSQVAARLASLEPSVEMSEKCVGHRARAS